MASPAAEAPSVADGWSGLRVSVEAVGAAGRRYRNLKGNLGGESEAGSSSCRNPDNRLKTLCNRCTKRCACVCYGY